MSAQKPTILGFAILLLAIVGVVAIVKGGLDAIGKAGAEEGERVFSRQLAAEASARAQSAQPMQSAAAEPTTVVVAEDIYSGAAPDRFVCDSVRKLRDCYERFGLSFTSSNLADGTPRLMGEINDKMTLVELLGRGGVVQRGSLIIGLPPDQPMIAFRNAGAIACFMTHTGWQAGAEWVANSMKTGVGKRRHGGVEYEITAVMNGIRMITAKPAASAK